MTTNWQTLFLSADGRIKRQDFWIGWLILFAAIFVMAFVPFLGQLFHLFSIYVTVCLYSKRLHDMGRSGWLQIAPWLIGLLCLLAGGLFFGTAIFSAFMAMGTGSPGPAAMAALLGSLGGFLIFLSVAGVIHLAFLIWIGVTPGQVGENRYGPDPLPAHAIDVF